MPGGQFVAAGDYHYWVHDYTGPTFIDSAASVAISAVDGQGALTLIASYDVTALQPQIVTLAQVSACLIMRSCRALAGWPPTEAAAAVTLWVWQAARKISGYGTLLLPGMRPVFGQLRSARSRVLVDLGWAPSGASTSLT